MEKWPWLTHTETGTTSLSGFAFVRLCMRWAVVLLVLVAGVTAMLIAVTALAGNTGYANLTYGPDGSGTRSL